MLMNINGDVNQPVPGNLLYKEEVFKIVGAAMEVHNQLGCGFLEGVYQEALEMELSARGIPFIPQQELSIKYKGAALRKFYVADLVAYQKIIVELKAAEALKPVDKAQVIHYLRATGFEVGVLINFGSEKLEWQRFIQTKNIRVHSPGYA
jgi:GxxExxY protein